MNAYTQTHTDTHTHTEGSSLLPSQTSKLADPWETSNAGEAIKRQKLFSVRSWFIWLKNETTNPTDIIFPSQSRLYQAQTKLLPGGNPLKSKEALPEEPELFCLLLSSSLSFKSIPLYSVSLPLHFSLGCHSLINEYSWFKLNLKTHRNLLVLSSFVWCSVSVVLACSACKQPPATITQWRKDKRGGAGVCWVCLREMGRRWNWSERAVDLMECVLWDRWKVWGTELREWLGMECPLKEKKRVGRKEHLKEIRDWWRQRKKVDDNRLRMWNRILANWMLKVTCANKSWKVWRWSYTWNKYNNSYSDKDVSLSQANVCFAPL